MTLKRVSQSLLARLIAFGLLLVILGSFARYYLLAKYLREDLTQLVSAQQLAYAEAVAQDIDFKLRERLRLLQRLAATLPQTLLDDPERLGAWLAERHKLNPVFSLGIVVADTRGTVLADYPAAPGRSGGSLAGDPDFTHALKGEGRIGRPKTGLFTGAQLLPMSVPLRARDGSVRAVLIGLTALAAPDFLDRISHGRIGESGGFLLVSPADRLFVAAGRPELAMKPTPPSGVNPLHDKAMDGFRGAGVTTNAQGVEEVSAIASVPSTGWFVVARLPTAEAYAPVRRAQEVVIRQSMIAVALVLGVAGFFIRRMLGPLHRAARLAERMTAGELPLTPLPVVRDDEVGLLTRAFNQLLGKLTASQVDLQRMAHHDELTGLPNRVLLADRLRQGLARARRKDSRIAALYLDLDGFKPINDSLGHEAGDIALRDVSARLRAVLRQSDTLARVGGDEFVLLVTDLASREDCAGVTELARRCIEAVAPPLSIKGHTLRVGVSIGIAFGAAHDDPEAVLMAADHAMYEAKKAGRGCYRIAEAASSPADTEPLPG
ncbi:putative signaling protein [Azoarcus olearius]|uniref:GGDEF domain-containing protein n=1 Tax=Azoarcus sp. (strain BH72) TaxID=418699 RepID=UPI00080634B8|nr:GGDEF domain-containing protein [Azoarcus olearius]ANQ85486.1 putative signaling protein [Azoarcus olearius]